MMPQGVQIVPLNAQCWPHPPPCPPPPPPPPPPWQQPGFFICAEQCIRHYLIFSPWPPNNAIVMHFFCYEANSFSSFWMRYHLISAPTPVLLCSCKRRVNIVRCHHWRLNYTEVQSQQMAFTQSLSLSNNPKIPTYYLIFAVSSHNISWSHQKSALESDFQNLESFIRLSTPANQL